MSEELIRYQKNAETLFIRLDKDFHAAILKFNAGTSDGAWLLKYSNDMMKDYINRSNKLRAEYMASQIPGKYTLSVMIDADDDAEVVFEGKSYCNYGDDFIISRTFWTLQECYHCLLNDIVITPGFKVSEWLRDVIREFVDAHKNGKDWSGYRGNQKVAISITK